MTKVPMYRRFWSKVKFNLTGSGCWEWKACKFTNGYGAFRPTGDTNNRHAQRVAYELMVGPIPPGLFVCHHCDNKACVNPDHLFLGTCADNVRDYDEKGLRTYRGRRHWAQAHPEKVKRGATHWNAKLTESDVESIRNEPKPWNYSAIGRKYGVTHQHAQRILAGRNWKQGARA